MSFSAADLQAIADGYDADSDPAPLVVGHPKMDDPAFGWVAGLHIQGDALVANPDRVEASFAEMVRAGRFAKISAQFYPPAHPSNPKPGAYYLKHVGFLGAAAPAVKGLGTVSLSEGDAGLLTFAALPLDPAIFNQENDVPNTSNPSAPSADQIASFAERETALATREAELKRREADAEKAAAAARHEGHVSFADGLVAGAKLAPAGKPLLVGVLDALGNAGDALASFGDGAGELSPTAALRKLFDTARPLVSLGESAPADHSPKGSGLASFAAPDGYEVDPAQAALHARAREIQDANPKLAWIDAVKRAQAV